MSKKQQKKNTRVAESFPEYASVTSMNWPQRRESPVFLLKQTYLRKYMTERKGEKDWS